MSLIRHLSSDSHAFDTELARLLDRDPGDGAGDDGVFERVRSILADVRRRGDEALLEHTARFDRLELRHGAALEIPGERIREALGRISAEQREALDNAGQRLKAYAEHQHLESWSIEDEFGNRLGQAVRPLDRVGIYVPGGKAAYPSSVLMNTVPAKVAGVTEVVMVVPAPDGELNDLVLAAAAIAGVDRIFTLGGAQAVAALAYGTESVPVVDKIVGPGNVYVATAKRLVFGTVGIDMIAGPSEVAIVADASADPEWLAMDLFAQAEHDEQAQSILVSADPAVLRSVEEAIERLLPGRPREAIIRRSLSDRGALIRVGDMAEAVAVINRIAPEHLELAVKAPSALMADIRHAGAVFLGHYSPEAFGDYCAGPNHVLPTSGTARFSSPLGVYDFQKRSSVIECVPGGVSTLADTAETLARGEGLAAHADSAALRRGH